VIACKIFYDIFVHHSSITLSLLVLIVDPVFSFFYTSILKLFEVVIFITCIVLFLLLIHKGKSLVMAIRLVHHSGFISSHDLLLVFLVDPLKFFLNFLVISRLAILGRLLDCFEINHQVAFLDLVLLVAVVSALPL